MKGYWWPSFRIFLLCFLIILFVFQSVFFSRVLSCVHSLLLNLHLTEFCALSPSPHTLYHETLTASQTRLVSNFLVLCGIVGAGEDSQVCCPPPPGQGSIYTKRLPWCTAGSLQRFISSFCELKCHLGYRAWAVEGGRVWSGGWRFCLPGRGHTDDLSSR